MKTKGIRLLFAALVFSCLLPLHAQYEPPTEGQLDQLMANPKLVAITMKGANGQEAAALLIRIIERIQRANLQPTQTSYLIAFYTARIAYLLPASEVQSFSEALIPLIPADAMVSVMGGISLGGRGSEGFLAQVEELLSGNEVWLRALRTPRTSLTNPVYKLLVQTLSQSQALPPSVTDSLPPPIPVGQGEPQGQPAPQPPPVPEPYDGQA